MNHKIKKSLLAVVLLLVFLAGLLIGAMLIGFSFYKNLNLFCSVIQKPEAVVSVSPEQASVLPSENIISGKIVSKNALSITLETQSDLQQGGNMSTTTVEVSFNAASDKVVTLVKQKNSNELRTVQSSFDDVKVNSQVIVEPFQNGKTIYILPS